MGNVSLIFMLVVVVLAIRVGVGQSQLTYDYYRSSCLNVETIVRQEMLGIFLVDVTAPAAFLRLMFHDCQVQAPVDSSVIKLGLLFLHENPLTFCIRKQEAIGYIKSVLEAECPGQVSCADIIVLAAKESVDFSGGPRIQIPLGRKDSTTSNNKQSDDLLPSPAVTVDELLHIFMSKGMDLEVSVAILG
ncbi:peroxidase 29 [Populus trichocarpa]|uniref:peroxidase 29 n=1 Tax=Populus trichocarpa TaxID=3694 RepID=UPI0022796CC9|nr:peroxidase 29 [Populus trichocarpa]